MLCVCVCTRARMVLGVIWHVCVRVCAWSPSCNVVVNIPMLSPFTLDLTLTSHPNLISQCSRDCTRALTALLQSPPLLPSPSLLPLPSPPPLSLSPPPHPSRSHPPLTNPHHHPHPLSLSPSPHPHPHSLTHSLTHSLQFQHLTITEWLSTWFLRSLHLYVTLPSPFPSPSPSRSPSPPRTLTHTLTPPHPYHYHHLDLYTHPESAKRA